MTAFPLSNHTFPVFSSFTTNCDFSDLLNLQTSRVQLAKLFYWSLAVNHRGRGGAPLFKRLVPSLDLNAESADFHWPQASDALLLLGGFRFIVLSQQSET